MRVLIQQPRLPHYRVPLMNRLVETHGWELTVAFTPRRGQGESGLEVSQSDLFECVRLPMRRYAFRGLKINFQRGLFRLLRAGRWDAFFWEGAHANFSGYLAARWCQRKGIPSICWLKGYFTSQDRLRRWMNRQMLGAAHAFLPYGDSTHAFLTTYGACHEQIVQAYNTVDVETIARKQNELYQQGNAMLEAIGWMQARPLITCVGRLIPTKRVNEAIAAVAYLTQHQQEAYLLVVGDGPERAALEELTHQLGIQSRVHFTGRVPEEGDSAALAVSDIAVFPGVHGLAINQAMALGTSVVVADLPGPDGEMVIHARTGWRYPAGDIKALAQALTTALHSPMRPEIITQAREEILQRRNLTQYAQAFAEAVTLAQNLRGH